MLKQRKNYIGLAVSFHDPALAIVNADGDVVFAEETARYLQDKRAFNCVPDHFMRTPKLIQEYCDPDAELVVGISWSKAYIDSLKVTSDATGLLSRFRIDPFAGQQESMWPWFESVGSFHRAMVGTLQQAASNLVAHRDIPNKVSLKYFDHHLTHAAMACYSSPFEEAACAVVDGAGEGRSYDFLCYHGGKNGGKISSILPPWTGMGLGWQNGSLGQFYAVLCGACGFDPVKGEEWKVMGLAPYGQFIPKLYDLLKSVICVDGLKIVYDTPQRYKTWLTTLREMRAQFKEPIDAADLAHNGQLVFQDIMLELLRNLHQRVPSNNLVLGGGCALNSTCNGIITEETPFTQLHVPSAPGDDGNAVGAALLAYHADHPASVQKRTYLSPYLGSQLSRESIEHFITFSQQPKIRHLPGEVHEHAAQLLAEGKIIGWLQGRAEFGPRALGNRSILADPRQPDMKDKINARVKFREEFRPFAPSILHEHGPDYFENYQETPYMERTLRFKPAVRDKVPAVVHANQTGRLQTVKREWSETYYDLIEAFYRLTGIPIILNTSYNVMGKPIAHSVEDALSVFYTTGLDALVIEEYLIEK